MQQQPQLQGVADLLANQGRYGDSMLVHMNPVEVQGLASMSPTGSLTINPETGQPEAFLPFLAPLLGSMLGTSALAGTAIGGLTLSPALAGAIGSGIATAATTGDIKKGLISGLGGFGIGSVLGGLGGAATEAATSATGSLGGGAPLKSLVDNSLGGGPPLKDLGLEAAAGLTSEGLEQAMQQTLSQPSLPSAKEIFSKEGLMSLTDPKAMIPFAVAEGINADLAQREAMEDFEEDEGGTTYEEAQAALYDNIYDPSIEPAIPYKSPRVDNYGDSYTQIANAGGIVSLDPNDFRKRFNGLVEMGAPVVGMQAGGLFPGNFMNYAGSGYAGAGGINNPAPRQLQASLRPPEVITPWQLQDTYAQQGLPGFGPEIQYFTTEDGPNPNPWWRERPQPKLPGEEEEVTDDVSEDTKKEDGKADPKAMQDLWRQFQSGAITYQQWLDAIKKNIKIPKTETKVEEKVTETVKETGTPSTGLSKDDYADLYDRYMNYGSGPFNLKIPNIGANIGMQEGGETQVNAEADRLIDLASMAILGRLPEEESDVVIQMFIDQFGEEAFQALREATLDQVAPGSQKEGEIVGMGGGMDDMIPGMIGDQQPVAVSPGEYIVPADVVSGIGDGSTDAGVQELDGMLDRVRMDRTGTMQQPAPLRKGGVLPR